MLTVGDEETGIDHTMNHTYLLLHEFIKFGIVRYQR